MYREARGGVTLSEQRERSADAPFKRGIGDLPILNALVNPSN